MRFVISQLKRVLTDLNASMHTVPFTKLVFAFIPKPVGGAVWFTAFISKALIVKNAILLVKNVTP